MTLEDLGNLGELLAALGVIASLIYLAIQIRQNTRSVRASTYQALTSSLTEVSRLLAESGEAATILHTGLADPSKLDQVEGIRFGAMLMAILRNTQNMYFQFSQKTLPNEYWLAHLEPILHYLSSPGGGRWWQLHQEDFAPEFVAHIDRAHKEHGQPYKSEWFDLKPSPPAA